MFSSHQSTLPRTPSFPFVSGVLPSMVRASTLTMSLSYSVSSASCHACLRTNSTTFCPTCSVFIFPPLFGSQLLLKELLQSIENAVPAFGVTVARFFAWQFLVNQTHFSAAVAIGQLHHDDAVVLFPILIVIPFPGEDDLLSRNELAVFTEYSHLLAFRIGEIPSILAAHAGIGDKVASANAFGPPPFF